MRLTAVLGTACIAAIGTVYAMQAPAADLGPTYPAPPAYGEPDPQFEFGTGWYLRGDASFGDEDHPVLQTGTGFNTTKKDWNYVLGGGVGYKFNSFLRFDVTGDYFEGRDYKATALDQVTGFPLVDANGAAVLNKASMRKYDGLANLYIDLGNWYGMTPYVGGGAGFVVYDPSEKLAVAKSGVYLTDNTVSKVKFAWAAMAGVSYQFDQNIAVDLGYRHMDLGRFSTTLVGYTIDHHYTEDQIRVSLRYNIF